jgi:hypothetical protein
VVMPHSVSSCFILLTSWSWCRIAAIAPQSVWCSSSTARVANSGTSYNQSSVQNKQVLQTAGPDFAAGAHS